MPLLALQTSLTIDDDDSPKGTVLKGARNLIKKSRIPKGKSVLIDESGAMSHLDPLTARPEVNPIVSEMSGFLARPARGRLPKDAHAKRGYARRHATQELGHHRDCDARAAVGRRLRRRQQVRGQHHGRPQARRCTKGDCTLREAIIRANEHSGPDKVLLPASDDPYALTRPGSGEDEGRKGDLDLGDSVSVKGRGPGRTVVIQRKADRVFHVDATATFGSSLERITIKGGDVSGGAGGGVLTEGRVFLGETRITGNRADFGGGAAALGSVSRLSLVRSSMTDNRADAGGGLYLVGADGNSHGVQGSLIEGNRAPEGGGGIFFLPGTRTSAWAPRRSRPTSRWDRRHRTAAGCTPRAC